MARGGLSLRDLDGGLGVTGPQGPSQYAAIGVSSEAEAIADQIPVLITSAGDVDTLFGVGELATMLRRSLRIAGSTVIAMPLQRAAGGTVRTGQAAQIGGTMITTAMTGHTLGRQHVRMEYTVAGAGGTSEIRLIVNGAPLPAFLPGAADYANPIVIPIESLGSLATGVILADRFSPTITSPTAAVVGDGIEFDFTYATALAADVAASVIKLADSTIVFENIALAGVSQPATWGALRTAARALPDSHGEYCGVHVQAAGNDEASGAVTGTTVALWLSAAAAAVNTPARLDAPRLHVWLPHAESGGDIEPAMYPALGMIARRQPWESVNEVGEGDYGILPGVDEIYPRMTGAQIDAMDNLYYATLQRHNGRTGIYITEARLWGNFPQLGVPGTDYSGTERRRTIDAACRVVRAGLLARVNANFPTRGGHIAPSAVADLEANGLRLLRGLESAGAFTDPLVVFSDAGAGILSTEELIFEVSIQPPGKARRINGTIAFSRGAPQETA